jgi:hypothetical protein
MPTPELCSPRPDGRAATRRSCGPDRLAVRVGPPLTTGILSGAASDWGSRQPQLRSPVDALIQARARQRWARLPRRRTRCFTPRASAQPGPQFLLSKIKLCTALWIGGGKACPTGDNKPSAVDGKRILRRWPESSCGRTAKAVEILYCRTMDDLPEGKTSGKLKGRGTGSSACVAWRWGGSAARGQSRNRQVSEALDQRAGLLHLIHAGAPFLCGRPVSGRFSVVIINYRALGAVALR